MRRALTAPAALRLRALRPRGTLMRGLRLPRARAGRALVGFWTTTLLAAAVLGGVLQWLGPPASPPASHPGSAPGSPLLPSSAPRRASPATPALSTRPAHVAAAPAPPAQAPPRRLEPRRLDIVPPDPALLEPAPHEPGAMLPRRAADGREARRLYAAPAPALPAAAPRIAILLDGIGLSRADSLEAIASLPPAVSLAVSPYATAPGTILEAARRTGHELLLSLPMQPARAPLDDEGGEAMTDHVGSDENLRRLEWSLSRIQGYAGVTDAAAGLGGERFVASTQFASVARQLAGRGLFYLDALPDQPLPAGIAAVHADLRLDAEADAAGVDAQLAGLERLAISRGNAVAVAGPVFPATVRRLAEWARDLPARGLALVPVSSLAREPQATPGSATPLPPGGAR